MQSKQITIILGILFLIISCARKHEYRQLTGYTQGTTYSILYEDVYICDYSKQIDSIFQLVNSTFSTYDSSSLISRINDNDTSVIVNDLFIDAYEKAHSVWFSTDGAFDITVGGLVNAWGFGKKQGSVPDSTQIDSMKNMVGMHRVKLLSQRIEKEDQRINIDLNGIAQGYTVDLVALFFEDMGLENYLVEIGGEVRVAGENSKGLLWRIGVDKPEDSNNEPGANIQTVLELDNRSVSTSGNYRKFYIEDGVKYSHTINPKTGYPAQSNLLSATVLADECAIADAYATSFMVMGFEKTVSFLEQHDELDVYLIYSDKSGNLKVFKTEGFEEIVD